MLYNAGKLDDLKVLPSDRLEKLSSGREGQHSIRINDLYRVCFHWVENNPHDVEIVD
jgi:proteic killer suppression protein